MRSLPERFSAVGKKALVTGASRGLGQTISDVLSAAGADIVAVGRDVAALEETRKIVENNGRKCMTIAADLRAVDVGEKVVAQVSAAWGAVDILVNNAGICISGSLLDFSVDDWDASFNVNLRAAFLFARAVAPGMIAQKSGKIINLSSQISNFAMLDLNINAAFRCVRAVAPQMMEQKSGDIVITSSISGKVPMVSEPVYTASKHAVQAFVHTARRKLAAHDVRISAIQPGPVATPLLNDWDQERVKANLVSGGIMPGRGH